MRDLATKSGLSASLICRLEAGGREVELASAIRLARALGEPLSSLVDDTTCPVCTGEPPEGFACKTCGRG